MSYNGKLNFGLLGDFDAMPGPRGGRDAGSALARRAPPGRRESSCLHRSRPGRCCRGRSHRLSALNGQLSLACLIPRSSRFASAKTGIVGRVRRGTRPQGNLDPRGKQLSLRPWIEPDRARSQRRRGRCGRSYRESTTYTWRPCCATNIRRYRREGSLRHRPDAGATFVDSSILRVLLEARRQAEESGLGFAIALGNGEGPGVRRILEVTGLMNVFPVRANREEALQTAKSAAAPS